MKRLCLSCGVLTDGTRCESCRLALQRAQDAHPAKRARKRALYGNAQYKTARAFWALAIANGAGPTCPRCGRSIGTDTGFDLGHQTDGGLQPEHPRCNRSQGRSS